MRKILILFVILAFSSIPAPAQQILEILKRIDAHRKALKSLTANITITQFSVPFGGTYTKEGTVKFLPGKTDYSLRMDSTKPVAEIFLIVNNQYVLYQPDPGDLYLPSPKSAFTGKVTDSQKNTLMIFSILTTGIVKTDYAKILYLGQDKVNTAPVWHLEFTPKTESKYKKLELWVDGNGMPIQSKMIGNESEATTVFLGDLQKNVKMKITDFRAKLPKGTQIIKN
jgi:outer membrane lipoprotein-sorting protein